MPLMDPAMNSAHILQDATYDARQRRCILNYLHTLSGCGSQLAKRRVSLYKVATLMGNSPEICRRHNVTLIPDAMTDDVMFVVSLTHPRIRSFTGYAHR